MTTKAEDTTDLAARLARIRQVLPPPGADRALRPAPAQAEAACAALTGGPGLLRWFRRESRVLDWSFFARPGGTFVAPAGSGVGETISDQRTLYYLQAAGPLTAGPGDLTLVSSSAQAGQHDLPGLWRRDGVLSEAALAATYVVEDLAPADPSLAGDTALAIAHALRHGRPVPVTPAARWLAGGRGELTREEFLTLLRGRVYTCPLRGLAHDELERHGIAVSVRHSITDSFERAALYPGGSLTTAARQMLPDGRLTWTADEAAGAVRELLRHSPRVYLKADGIGSSAVAVAESAADAARQVGELRRRCRLSDAIGAGRPAPDGDRFAAPVEIAADVTGGRRPLRHFTVQVLIGGPEHRPRVELLAASAKQAGIAFGSGPLDEAGTGALRRRAGELAEIALAARPAGCELLSLEGFVLAGGEGGNGAGHGDGLEVKLIEANLRLAGMSQLYLAARAVAAALAPDDDGGYLVGNVAVPPGQENGEVLDGLRKRAAGRPVMLLGRERADSAKILVLGGEPGCSRDLFR